MSSVQFIRHRSADSETDRRTDTTNLYSCKSDSYVIRGSYTIAGIVKSGLLNGTTVEYVQKLAVHLYLIL